MKTANYLLAALLLLGCSKKNTPPPQDEEAPRPTAHFSKIVKGHLLKACDIALIPGALYRIEYVWNADSSLQKLKAINPATKDTVDTEFHYSNGFLSRLTTENSHSEGLYTYLNGKVDRISSRNIIIPTGRNYYFIYNPDTTVARIRHYRVNEAGEQLEQEVNYAYDAAKRPTVITNTQPNGHVRIIRIQEWSAKFLFSPWIFAGSELDQENYELFNVPLLFHLNQMPVRFAEYVKPVQGAEVMTRRWEVSHTIQNEKLLFRRAQVFYPDNPQMNRTVEHTFHY